MTQGYSLDSIRRGTLVIAQPIAGYRFNVDSVLLAQFAAKHGSHEARAAMDLGAGTGIVGLLLAKARRELRVTLLELQEELAALCRENVERNQLGERVSVVAQDLRTLIGGASLPGSVDLVVCNPPFFVAGSGKVSPIRQVAIGRHELECTLDDVVRAAATVSRAQGELAMIHLAARRAEVMRGLAGAGFARVIERLVQARPDRPAHRLLVIASRRASLSIDTLPPLIVHERPGQYSEEMKEILGEPTR